MDIAHIPEMLPLKSDFVFKRVFGDENNVDVLTGFWQANDKQSRNRNIAYREPATASPVAQSESGRCNGIILLAFVDQDKQEGGL